MKTSSPAISLLQSIWEHGAKDSWGRINHSMRNALELAIGSGLEFHEKDFSLMGQFRWGHWVGSSHEWIYTMAIVNGNESCIKAYEAYVVRQPFRANFVNCGYMACRGGYIHANSVSRQRERLAVGFSFPLDGFNWHVTSFDDAHGNVRIARYAGHHSEGKPVALRKLNIDSMKDLFPTIATLKKRASKSTIRPS